MSDPGRAAPGTPEVETKPDDKAEAKDRREKAKAEVKRLQREKQAETRRRKKARRAALWSAWREEAVVYADHMTALAHPGRPVATHRVASDDVSRVGSIDHWSDADLDLLIEEGRRTFDSQSERFDRIRTTAQVLLPTAIALLIVLGSEVDDIAAGGIHLPALLALAAWSLGTWLVLMGFLGTAAVLTVRSDFGMILPTLLSQETEDIKRRLAAAYAEQAMVGEATVATRLTVIRDAVTLVALGGSLQLVLWFLRSL